MKGIIVGVLFLYNSIADIKSRTISNRGLLIGGGIIGLLLLVESLGVWLPGDSLVALVLPNRTIPWNRSVPWENILGIVPGLGVLLLSYLIKGGIGRGDGYLLCISGAALGWEQNLALLCYGLFLAGLVSAVLLLLRRVKRSTKLPFVPFLFAGFLITVYLEHEGILRFV